MGIQVTRINHTESPNCIGGCSEKGLCCELVSGSFFDHLREKIRFKFYVSNLLNRSMTEGDINDDGDGDNYDNNDDD